MIEDRVVSLLSDILDIEKDELLNRKAEKGVWDSLQRVEIVLALESEFDVMLEGEEIASLLTINNIVELLEKKVD